MALMGGQCARLDQYYVPNKELMVASVIDLAQKQSMNSTAVVLL